MVYLHPESVLVTCELAKEDLVGDGVQEMGLCSVGYVQLPWLFQENVCTVS